MDHFQTYIVPAIQRLQVPLLSGETYPYDMKGFWGFPERLGLDPSELWSSSSGAITDQGRLALLQSWLYFAFAHEIMGRIVDNTPSPLLPQKLTRDGRIDSSQLILAATAWMAAEQCSRFENAASRIPKLTAVLEEVQKVIRAIFAGEHLDEISYLGDKDSGDMSSGYLIIISILLLGEQIDEAMEAIYGEPRLSTRALQWPCSSRLGSIYCKIGNCCKTELKLLMRSTVFPNSIAIFNFAVQQLLPQRDHSKCSEEKCHALEKPGPSPAHVEEGCICKSVHLHDQDQARFEQYIREGRFPMLTVHSSRKDPTVHLQISEFQRAANVDSCIAISHLWSDKLGNPTENSMPTCQLQRLQKLVNDLVKEQLPKRPEMVGFWIDTLCVPIDPELKKLALGTMENIYRDATAVLVLDKLLLGVSYKIGWLATLWQIYSSNWYRRLWTLQEGVLNPLTFFALSDDFPAIEALVTMYDSSETLSKPLKECRAFIQKINAKGIRRIFPKKYSTKTEHTPPALLDPLYKLIRYALLETRRTIVYPDRIAQRLLHELAWRDATYATDESICLGILVGYDMDELLKMSSEAQLAAVIGRMSSIPAPVLFSKEEKLNIDGHRWIPKTFLGQGAYLETDGAQQWGTPTSKGLRISLPALRQKNKSIKFVDMTYHGQVSQAMLGLEIGSYKLRIMCIGSVDGFFEAFFGDEDGGFILLGTPLQHSDGYFTSGYLVTLQNIVNQIYYVTPIKPCIVSGDTTVYGNRTRYPSLTTGFVLQAGDRRPVLQEWDNWGPAISSEAEYIESCMWCVG